MSIHDETEAETRAERIDPLLAAAREGLGADKVLMTTKPIHLFYQRN
jgi:hypothetical protein